MDHLLFILGASNGVDGSLSPIALSRVAEAIAVQRRRPDVLILATGGFGAFNATTTPHREFVHAELAARNARHYAARPTDLLSANTVEDALFIVDFARRRGHASYSIVTSNFHVRRCELVFGCLAKGADIGFIAATDPAAVVADKLRHEADAVARLVAQGGVVVGDQLHPFAPAH